ncbi:hypothetical protein EVAR_83100_1 [Eumeta japonica]|uniref:Uncharacterized protein n=1 Tax=Eumeta variegata TaxID=151549 RepID=A0A4C1WPI4_EUMVA|nr:hypothetical protein EVAR_83100_1 [Eumeta japonica]
MSKNDVVVGVSPPPGSISHVHLNVINIDTEHPLQYFRGSFQWPLEIEMSASHCAPAAGAQSLSPAPRALIDNDSINHNISEGLCLGEYTESLVPDFVTVFGDNDPQQPLDSCWGSARVKNAATLSKMNKL